MWGERTLSDAQGTIFTTILDYRMIIESWFEYGIIKDRLIKCNTSKQVIVYAAVFVITDNLIEKDIVGLQDFRKPIKD